ncbi:unnamed protein product [Arabis nemorensis]|uniref:Uncharacterized protein n=1 Tax=Arabis nemorensis TaxID=586526 RepID=A0A565AZ59_9BRAS|nr:unnamed protein product [Arabis nemorensis]
MELSKPINPPMWCDLVIQFSLLLQGSFSRLMIFSTFGGVLVTVRVAMDAVIQEAHKIVLAYGISL